MVESFKKIDYRLRPAKHAERTMFIDLFKRFRFSPIESYQYVGFGSVAFVDFRMIHRALGIKKLTSIEFADDQDEILRFKKNSPYSGLSLYFGKASSVLPQISFDIESLVWLDYDDLLERSMSNDLASIAARAKSGTFIAVTFQAGFPTDSDARQTELKRLREEFPEFVAHDAKAQEFDGKKYSQFGRYVLGSLLEKSISDADAGLADANQVRSAKQVCYFDYRDGARMATVGWLIVAKSDLPVFDACKLEALPFFRKDKEPFKIEIPLVTPLEIREMEKRLPDLANCTDLDWIPEKERRSFDRAYRYLPQFSVIEQI